MLMQERLDEPDCSMWHQTNRRVQAELSVVWAI